MNWNNGNFDDLSSEVSWNDSAEKAKKIQQWRDLSRVADTHIEKIGDAIKRVENSCEQIAKTLYPAGTFPASEPVVSSQFWQDNYPGVTSLLENSRSLSDSVNKLAIHLQVSADNAKLSAAGVPQLEAATLLAAPLFNQIKMVKALCDIVHAWERLPTTHASQNAADEKVKDAFTPISKTFTIIRELSDSLSLTVDKNEIKNYASQVTRQAPVFEALAERVAQDFLEKGNHHPQTSGTPQPLFPQSQSQPARELVDQIIGEVFAGEVTTDEALTSRGTLKMVSRAFHDLIDTTPTSDEARDIEQSATRHAMVETPLAMTNDAILQSAKKRNRNFTSKMLEDGVRAAIKDNLNIGIDLTQVPEERRGAVLDVILENPRERLAIKASGITPVSDLLNRLQAFNEQYPSKLKDVRLDLSGTDLRPEDAKLLEGLPVSVLYVAHNQNIGDEGFAHIANLGSLTALDASSTHISAQALNTLAVQVTGMKELCLNDNYSVSGFSFNQGFRGRLAMIEVEKMGSSSISL